MSNSKLATDLLLIDVETTGTDPTEDRIVQLAAVHLSRNGLRDLGSFVSLARPDRPISVTAQKIHGLTSEQLADAPSERELVEHFESYAPRQTVLCGHNVGFDVNFLRAAYDRQGIPFRFDYHTVDVWSLVFFILGAGGVHLPKYNLDYLAGLYSIRRSREHDALEDVKATAEILRNLFVAVSVSDISALGQMNLFGEEK